MIHLTRRGLAVSGFALGCSGLTPNGAFARTGANGLYVCPPCGCAMDGRDFNAPGQCPACGMTLVPKAAEAQRFSPAQLRSDFTALYAGLRRAHYNMFANLDPVEADRLYAEIAASLDQNLTALEAKARFQRFVAAGKIAHARIDFLPEAFAAFRASGGKAFPLAVRIEGGKLYISGHAGADARLDPGDEIETISGRPAAEWLTRFRQYVSADNDYLAGALMAPQFSALLWLAGGEQDAFPLTLRKANGTRAEITLAATSREVPQAMVDSSGLLTIDPAQRAAYVTPDGVACLRPGVFVNLQPGAAPSDPAAFHSFIDEAFTQFLDKGVTRLIVDLRDNPGGHNAFSDHMIAWFADRPFRFCADFRVRVSPEAVSANTARLGAEPSGGPSHQLAAAYESASEGDIVHLDIPETAPRQGQRFKGAVGVLVNRRSYSNAVSAAAIVQDYGFGSVLGEPTADLATTYGSMEQFELPETGISVGFPKAYIIRPSGDERVAGVTPDIAITTPMIEPDTDPVLRDAMKALPV